MSIPTLCRLCLYNANDCVDLTTNNPDELRERIEKFLHIEIIDSDLFAKTVCSKCIERIAQFHEFYMEVAQNQEILQYSQPITTDEQQQSQILIANDLTKTIHLPYVFNLKGVVTLQPVTNGISTFDITTGTTTIDLQQFVPDVTQDDHNIDDNLLTGHCDDYETIAGPPIVNVSEENDLEKTTEIISSNIETFVKVEKDDISSSPPAECLVTIFDENSTKLEKTEPVVVNENKLRSTRRTQFSTDGRNMKAVNKSIENDISEILEESSEHGDDQNQDRLRNEDEMEYSNFRLDDDDDDVDEDNMIIKSPGIITGDYCNDDDDVSIDEIDLDNEKFVGFPKYIIKNSKLIIRGKPLLEMMSRFYRLECDLCPTFKNRSKFVQIETLYHHYIEEHAIKGYVICCGIKLIKFRAMAMHMARHLQPEAFQCPMCDKMLTCPKILQFHMKNHLPEEERPLACPDCPRKFSYSSALVAHAISHQPESQRAAHVCDECGKVFVSAGRLHTHINVTHTLHVQDYICHICAKQFACRSNLSYHLTTHQPRVHNVQCEKCGKWLKNKLCLRKHMVQHSTIRFSCTQCNYSALNRQCLRNHMKVQHTDLKPFTCDVCPKAFKLKNTLLNHMVQHTGVRKYSCPFCNRTFASSGNYYTHRKRMHPQELAALKQKREEEERILREKALSETTKNIS